MTSHLIYYLSEQFPDAFMVTIVSLKSFSTQRDVHLMNDGPVKASDQDVHPVDNHEPKTDFFHAVSVEMYNILTMR